jgi:hypothetical protein
MDFVTLTAMTMLQELRGALSDRGPVVPVTLEHGGSLSSTFAVSDLAQASIGVAGAALSQLVGQLGGSDPPPVRVDRDLASAWFGASIRPLDFELPPVWDAVAGDYATRDGWIKLHTNAPHHREAVLDVLGVPGTRDAVAGAAAAWSAGELENAVVGAGGAAAMMRTHDEWTRHPQGRAVSAEPLVAHESVPAGPAGNSMWSGTPERPLAGVRVLDLTRVLAGPVATRLLAGWGADVLRIDPPEWDEPAIVPEVTLGKHCARLDLRTPVGRHQLLALLGSADVLVHGYRSDALEGLDLGPEVRAECRPRLVDVTLDAYGWSGPWRTRRGFDSLVQMSTGIADAGRRSAGTDRPVPLPAQALDHATGYLLAAAAITGLTQRGAEGMGSRWRTSLARVASLLIGAGEVAGPAVADEPRPAFAAGPVERTAWGRALRIPVPLAVEGAPILWSRPARALGSDPARWEE